MRQFQKGQHYVFKVPGNGRLWWGLVLAVGLGLVWLLLLSGDKSLFTVVALYREQTRLAEQIADLKVQNQELRQQIGDLQTDPKAVERIAREELGMVRGDETVYRFVSPELAKKDRE